MSEEHPFKAKSNRRYSEHPDFDPIQSQIASDKPYDQPTYCLFFQTIQALSMLSMYNPPCIHFL
ncbi:hypothetical protein EW026_g7811 [Hermanssonia centrifuga]|uniref:Uncharacterized protein n=1 Tax=Hermanssonia centrifuga TaxID=98765 RepID=A0A4S4K6K3_9APHY|nr:hypothetical protein EW026_g7811 [Hermanssonia centrifuga]